LLAVLVAGCQFPGTQQSTSWMDRFRPFQGSNQGDVVTLDIALVEQPLFDPYINTELWNLADEQGVPLERKALLADNGLRVGQIGGITPPELQALLESKRSDRCPRRLQTRSGAAKELTLGPPAGTCRFSLHQDGHEESSDLSLDHAEFSLMVTPTLAKEGQITLRFTPQVRHGDVQNRATPTADHTSLMWQAQRTLRTFSEVSWEVTVPSSEYVVIGARGDKPGTLGAACFIRRDEARPVQRLLVIRSARTAPGIAQDYEDKKSGGEPGPRSPSLASQAVMSGTAVPPSGGILAPRGRHE
jgi:hypothetical protein